MQSFRCQSIWLMDLPSFPMMYLLNQTVPPATKQANSNKEKKKHREGEREIERGKETQMKRRLIVYIAIMLFLLFFSSKMRIEKDKNMKTGSTTS